MSTDVITWVYVPVLVVDEGRDDYSDPCSTRGPYQCLERGRGWKGLSDESYECFPKGLGQI